jgi:hypothetical protein
MHLQQVYSALVGTELETGIASLELSAGPALVRQSFTGSSPSASFAAASLNELVNIPLEFISAESGIDQAFRLVLPFRETGDRWHANGFLALRLAFTRRFGITITVYEDYVANTPAEFEKNFLTVSAGLSVKLGRLPN